MAICSGEPGERQALGVHSCTQWIILVPLGEFQHELQRAAPSYSCDMGVDGTSGRHGGSRRSADRDASRGGRHGGAATPTLLTADSGTGEDAQSRWNSSRNRSNTCRLSWFSVCTSVWAIWGTRHWASYATPRR